MACGAANSNSLAARVHILERQLQNGAQERDDIGVLLLAAARKLCNLLDTHAGQVSHSLSVAIRRARVHGYLAEHTLKRIRRANIAANTVRHATEFALTQLVMDVGWGVPLPSQNVVKCPITATATLARIPRLRRTTSRETIEMKGVLRAIAWESMENKPD